MIIKCWIAETTEGRQMIGNQISADYARLFGIGGALKVTEGVFFTVDALKEEVKKGFNQSIKTNFEDYWDKRLEELNL